MNHFSMVTCQWRFFCVLLEFKFLYLQWIKIKKVKFESLECCNIGIVVFFWQADVFSYGITLYSLLTNGKHPFSEFECKGEMDKAIAEVIYFFMENL